MSNVQETLNHVAGLVLQDWAFLLVEPDNGAEAPADKDPYVASVRIRGEDNVHRVSIECAPDIAKLICENIGGDADGEDSDEPLTDALKELANVFAGHFVTEFFGIDEPFELLPPEIKRAPEQHKAEASVRLMADDFPIMFKYHGCE